jgi:methylmalonyl-CoA mutase
MNEKDLNLFSVFPPVSTEAWDAQINTDLKGKDYEKALVWQTNEGFKVRPYYRQENLKDLNFIHTLPGQFPYVRGKKAVGNEWLIRQDIDVTELGNANLKAVEVLSKGADSIGFIFRDNQELTLEDIKKLLNGIDLTKTEINFSMPGRKKSLFNSFLSYLKEEKIDPSKLRGSINYDSIGAYTLRGKFCTTAADSFTLLKEILESFAGYPNFQIINVNGSFFNNAGSSIVQELGFSLAAGAEYLTQLTELGSDAAAVATKMRFNFGISGNYFMEIAKLRAARMLWAKLVNAYSPENGESAGKAFIHSETSLWNKSVYDPYVNMLRTQTEAMSAALGGTDSLTVLPYDLIYEQPTEFSERIARNQQSLLKDEAHFDKITDPAGGSYFIENLTASIAEQSWKLFLEIQDKGGFLAAFKEGFIQTQLKTMAEKKLKAIASRRENILGVNQFANVNEQIKSDMCPAIFNAEDLSLPGSEVETIKMFRGAQQFEALRYSTDQYSELNPRPKVFLLTIGDLTMRKARAQFSANFFAVAGYEIIDNNGFSTVEDGIKAAKIAEADIVVLCSSDDEYTKLAPEAFNQLNNEAIFAVAGAPASMEELKAAGIENFIHIKSNLLETLTEYNNKLGIKKAI